MRNVKFRCVKRRKIALQPCYQKENTRLCLQINFDIAFRPYISLISPYFHLSVN